jgi:hypothetical protein
MSVNTQITIPESVQEEVETLQNILTDYQMSSVFPNDPLHFLDKVREVDPEMFAAIHDGIVEQFGITSAEFAETVLAFVYPTTKALASAIILDLDALHAKLRRTSKRQKVSFMGYEIDLSVDLPPLPTCFLIVNFRSPTKVKARSISGPTLVQAIDLHEVGAAAALIWMLCTEKVFRTKYLGLKAGNVIDEEPKGKTKKARKQLMGRMVSCLLKMHPYDLSCLLALDYRKISRQMLLLRNFFMSADGEWFIYDGRVEETVVGAAVGIGASYAKWVRFAETDQMARSQRLTAFILSELISKDS